MMHFLARRRRLFEVLAGAAIALFALMALTSLVGETGWIGAAALAVVAVASSVAARRLRKRVPRRTFLEVDLEQGVVEQMPAGPARLLDRDKLPLRDLLDAIERAAGDARIDALVARIGSGAGLGLAQVQELRDAVARFRAAGKRAVAYAETFGEDQDALTGYYLAAAFEEVYLQPAGSLGLTGMVARVPFLRGAFDKLGMLARFSHREEYKSAKYLLTETAFTDPHREAVESLLDAQYDAVMAGIAADRGLEESALRAAIDGGPLLGGEAAAAGLVDGLAYRDEVYERLAGEHGGRPLYLSAYLKKAGRPHRKGTPIALIHATGDVARGASRFSVFPSVGQTMGSDTVAAAFREAVKSAKVEAIVCRVDSRGGSAVASETILREVVRAREAGKPVIVTMGNVAASGGYYVAARATKIVAQPLTVTGSIGVVSGKLVTTDAWRRVGVTFDHAARGENALFFGPGFDYGERGAARLEASLDDVYDRFVGHVAAGRGLEPEQVRAVAKGRVWTGTQAKERGLVDELGGLDVALRLARAAAGLAEDAPVKVVEFPRRRRRLPWAREESSEAAALAGALRAVDPLIGSVAAATPRGELVLTPGHAAP